MFVGYIVVGVSHWRLKKFSRLIKVQIIMSAFPCKTRVVVARQCLRYITYSWVMGLLE